MAFFTTLSTRSLFLFPLKQNTCTLSGTFAPIIHGLITGLIFPNKNGERTVFVTESAFSILRALIT